MALCGLAELCRVLTEIAEAGSADGQRANTANVSSCVYEVITFMENFSIIQSIPRPDLDDDRSVNIRYKTYIYIVKNR